LLALSSLSSFFRGFRLLRFDLYDWVGDLSSDRNGISQIAAGYVFVAPFISELVECRVRSPNYGLLHSLSARLITLLRA
jgi:hypothetical protein